MAFTAVHPNGQVNPMRTAITDPLSALALLSALIMLAVLSTFALQPKLMGELSASNEHSFSKAMRGESNGESGRDYDRNTERRDI